MTGDVRDLFHLDRALTPSERKRLHRRYQKNGYATVPGSGPAGETCKTCKHIVRLRYARVYRKCGLMRSFWTHGPGTDIEARSPACRRWEKPDGSGDRTND
jgi:hypothetical protein